MNCFEAGQPEILHWMHRNFHMYTKLRLYDGLLDLSARKVVPNVELNVGGTIVIRKGNLKSLYT